MINAAPIPIFTLAEWQTEILPDLSLTTQDRHLLDRVSTRLELDELRQGLRISARSWVGVVRFTNFEVQITPKLAGENIGLVRMIDFAHGLDCLDRLPGVNTIPSGGSSLFDLIAMLHAEACEALVRGGLLADYREVEEDLPVVRGRLLLAKQYLKRFGQIDRIECRYDEQLTDIPENQLLLAALVESARRTREPGVQLRIRRLVNVFSSACSLDGVDLDEIRIGIAYNRLNEHYRTAHSLAWLILEGLGVQDLFGGGDRDCFAFLLDMNRLFEDFVFRWLSRLFIGSGFRLVSQHHANSILWNADLRVPYTHVRPDILIQQQVGRGRGFPIDAKYKLYQEGVALGDLYQAFLYAFAWGTRAGVLPSALLVYPSASAPENRLRLNVLNSAGVPGGEIVALGIHIPTVLAEAKAKVAGMAGAAVHQCIQKAFAEAGGGIVSTAGVL